MRSKGMAARRAAARSNGKAPQSKAKSQHSNV